MVATLVGIQIIEFIDPRSPGTGVAVEKAVLVAATTGPGSSVRVIDGNHTGRVIVWAALLTILTVNATDIIDSR